MQAIYAGMTSETTSADDVAGLFDSGIEHLKELGIMQLSTLPQLLFVAERGMEAAMQKFMPTTDEKNPSRRFVDNAFVARLSSSLEYKHAVDRMKIDWSDHTDLFRKVFASLKQSKQYEDYIKTQADDFESDRAMALVAFKYLMNDEKLREVFYDRELLWEDDFDQIAQYNYMMLKDMSESSMSDDMPCPLVYDSRQEKDVIDFNFAHQLAIDTFVHIDDNEPLIRRHLQNWEMERVALMDVILINMAITEFTCCPSIPERVTVDEYIELSKEFSTDKSKLFINGILDKVLIELRVDGRINKDERGLYDPTLPTDN